MQDSLLRHRYASSNEDQEPEIHLEVSDFFENDKPTNPDEQQTVCPVSDTWQTSEHDRSLASSACENDAPNNQSPHVDSNEMPETRVSVMQREDAFCRPIIDYLERNILPRDDQTARKVLLMSDFYMLENCVLYHFTKKPNAQKVRPPMSIVVPKAMKVDIMQQFHTDTLGGHLGQDRTLGVISARYYWPEMRKDIHEYVRTCNDCNMQKRPKSHTKAPLSLLPMETCISGHCWSVDYHI